MADSTLKIGAVCYFNSAPLVHCLRQCAPHVQIVKDVPSRLSQALEAGELDVALIPSIEALRLCAAGRGRVVSEHCIACRGPVRSVKLFSRVDWPEVRVLALDEGSRTSAALVQILLAELFEIRPATVPLPLGATLDDSTADATMLIGDRAFAAAPEGFPYACDLGETWYTWQRLPFVFAVWTARPEVDPAACRNILDRAATKGLAQRDALAAAWSRKLDLPVDLCREYLTRNLCFTLGPEERAGLRRFAELARAHQLPEPGVDLVCDFEQHPGTRRRG